MTNVDEIYNEILSFILKNGVKKETRSGLVRSVFGRYARFDLSNGIPVLTTRKVFLRGVIEELLWFLSGKTNIKPLLEKGVNIWNADAERYLNEKIDKANKDGEVLRHPTHEEFIQGVLDGKKIGTYTYGDLGPVYGKNWRHFGVNDVDQVKNLIDKLKTNPNDRRMLITGYNPDDVNEAALPPCHLLYQFYTTPIEGGRRKLSCSLYCRSQDFLLGTVFNWASASILVYMIAKVVGMEPGELVWFGGDVHVYENQIAMTDELFSRKGFDKLPTLKFAREINDIDDFKYEDFIIEGYESDPPIKIPLSVG